MEICLFSFSAYLWKTVRNSAIIKVFTFSRANLSMIEVPTLSADATVICVLVLIGGICVAIVILSLLLEVYIGIATLIVIDDIDPLCFAFV